MIDGTDKPFSNLFNIVVLLKRYKILRWILYTISLASKLENTATD